MSAARASTWTAIGTVLAGSSFAFGVSDAAPQPAVPKTIWQSGADGAVHQQSQLQCPVTVAQFHLAQLRVFRPTGLDVGCDYQTSEHDEITLYSTLGPPSALSNKFDLAKAALEKRSPSAVPLDSSEQQSFVSALDWRHLIYRLDGAALTGVWMAEVGAWTVEYRATFAANRTSATLAAMTDLTAIVEKSAGAHVATCASLPPTQRNGQKIVDEAMFPALQMSGMFMANAMDTDPKWKDAANWCVQRAVIVSGVPFLMWRNAVRGKDGVVNRLTSLVENDSFAVYGVTDTQWPQILKQGAKLDIVYDIVIDTLNTNQLVGVYDGLPPLQELVRFAPRNRPFLVYAAFDKQTKKMTLYRPPL